MTEAFDILNRSKLPSGSFCLDASAGTGKTFSIENFISRQLLETDFTIEQFLVVTFTRAAAFDLKTRILRNLEKTLITTKNEGCQKKLRLAIANFDLATITTIHSFCFNALKEHSKIEGVPLKIEEGSIDSKLAYQALRDLFCSEIIKKKFTEKQLTSLLKPHSNSSLELAKQIVKLLERGLKIAPSLSNEEILVQLKQKMALIKLQGWHKEKFLQEYLVAVKQFKEICNRKGEPKEEINFTFETIAELFEEVNSTTLDQLTLFQEIRIKFSEDNLKTKGYMPHEWLGVVEQISKYIYEWIHPSFLLLRLLTIAEPFIQIQYVQNQAINFTDLLLKVEALSDQQAFQDPLRKRYRQVIIDEFQDTDPVQWKIFQQIFFKAGIPLMLVGDPKQSIYAFRSADIYTYLKAAKTIGESHQFFLDVNYRSSKELVTALNTLFAEEKAPGWISLPKIKSHLPYPSVKFHELKEHPFKTESSIIFLAHQGSLTFKDFEADYLFPFFAKELVRLHQDKQCTFSQIAFLVRDHAQAERLSTFLRMRNFPVNLQKSAHFSTTDIATDLFYLLKAILHPKEMSGILTALGTRFFKLSLEELNRIKQNQELFKILPFFIDLQNVWETKGLYGCLSKLLESSVPGRAKTVGETILRGYSGRQDYDDLFRLIAWLLSKTNLAAESLLKELENVISTDYPFKENLKLESHASKNAIQIMTLHMSKGLEFEVVFALGVMNRQRGDDSFMMVRENDETFLKPIVKNDPAYHAHLEETDAEKARQLYVALTRAKYKLYIPLLSYQKSAALGEASPLELFLAKRLGVQEWKKVYELLNESEIDWSKTLSDFECHFLKADQSKTCYSPPKIDIAPPENFLQNFEEEYVTSFTQLAKPLILTNSISSPRDFANLSKTVHTLPAGVMTGELLHQMIEEIPLELIRGANGPMDLCEFIARYTNHTIYREWNSVLAEIVFNAFSTPLGSSEALLKNLDTSDFFKEVEFSFSTQDLPFCTLEQKEIKGVIDFAFQKGNDIYLIDWKSNWLGDSVAAYSVAAMQNAIKQHQYTLQAKIYLQAFHRYLRKFPQSQLKGIFYFFLRGPQTIFIPFKACI